MDPTPKNETLRHRERMRILNESYERLRSNKKLWKHELSERSELEGTLVDGLDDEHHD